MMKALAVVPPDSWMEINLIQTLRQYYCDDLYVFHYSGMGQLGSRQWRIKRDELNEELLRVAGELKSAGRLDLIFFVVYDDFLKVGTATCLRSLGAPMVNYHVDMVGQWYRILKTAPYFDMIAVAQLANSEHLASYNRNIHWMPMAANPDFYRSLSATVSTYRYGVSFVGSFNPSRRALLAECVRGGVTPVVFGSGWGNMDNVHKGPQWDLYKIIHDARFYAFARWRAEGVQSLTGPIRRKLARRHTFQRLNGVDFQGPCENKAIPVIFRASRVNLGFSDIDWYEKSEVTRSAALQSRLRDFEVPMSGGFYLAQEVPEHRDFYVIGKEIETWSQPEELIDKAKFFSRNEKAADLIRERGQKRALEEHTWRHRFDSLFRRLKADGKLA